MDEEQRRHSLKRREVLRVLTAVPAAALLPVRGRAVQMEMPPAGSQAAPARAAAPTAYQPRTLDAHEYKTVQALSDLIIPADERSGSATQAGVPEFIDDWLDFKGGVQLDTIRGGLTWLDLESNRAFGRDFVGCSEAQQKQLLDRIAYPKTAAPGDGAGVAFFNSLRDLVLNGFYSSKMGVQDLPYLGNQVVADWEGCPPKVIAKLGLRDGSEKN